MHVTKCISSFLTDYSKADIYPFTVAMPNVNYPPGLATHSYRMSHGERMTNSINTYQYTTIIKFASGREVELLPGHTTFHPAPPETSPQIPFTMNITFEESERDRCGEGICSYSQGNRTTCTSGMKDTLFGAMVTLEGGNVVRTGTSEDAAQEFEADRSIQVTWFVDA